MDYSKMSKKRLAEKLGRTQGQLARQINILLSVSYKEIMPRMLDLDSSAAQGAPLESRQVQKIISESVKFMGRHQKEYYRMLLIQAEITKLMKAINPDYEGPPLHHGIGLAMADFAHT